MAEFRVISRPDEPQAAPTFRVVSRPGQTGPVPLTPAEIMNFDPRMMGKSPRKLRMKAEEAGVSTEGAGVIPRFDLNLGLTGPQEETETARRALERHFGKPVEVRTGPETGQLEFRPQGETQFTLVNQPGLDLGDIAAAVPEVGVFGAGAAGAFGGATGGSAAGPVGTVGGGIAGEAMGEGVAEFGRLLAARERGLIDGTDADLFELAAKRAGIAAATGAAGAAVLRAFQRLVAGTFRLDPRALVAAGGADELERGAQAAADVQSRAQAATGQPLPLTAGQTGGATEALAGKPSTVSGEALAVEQRARTFGDEGAALRDIDRQQQRVVEGLEAETFGPRRPETIPAGGRAVRQTMTETERRAQGPVQRRIAQAETDLAGQQNVIGTVARQPEAAVTSARENIDRAREEVFEPFRAQFDALQSERGIDIDLSGFRKAAKGLEKREGQRVLESVSLHSQSRLLKEAKGAGQREVERLEPDAEGVLRPVTRMEEAPPTLGEVQRALRDIRRELRRPGIADEPQKRRLLMQLRDQLVEARNAALSPEDRARVLELEAGFAREADRFDRGIVGEFTETNQFGRPTLAGDDALNRLLRNRRNAEDFTSAVSAMPGSERILTDVQDAVLGKIDRQFIDPETGEIASARLETFLRNNRESLQALFANRPTMLKTLESARTAAAAAKRNRAKLEKIRNAFSKRFGVFSADPAVLVPTLMREGNVENLRTARRILQSRAPDRVKAFDQAVAETARQRILGENQTLTAGAIDSFLRSETGRTTSRVLGAQFNSNLKTLRDVLRLVEQRAPSGTARDLTADFGRGIPGLQGMMRFTRVFFPPLSARGRGLTAVVGVTSERNRRRIANLLADPEKLVELARLVRIDPRSEAGRIIVGRLGLEYATEDGESGE